MKVVLTYPYSWPEVRRGGERLFHDLAVYLASEGLQISAVTTRGRDGPPGYEPNVVRRRSLPDLRLPRGFVFDRPVTYLPGAAADIARLRPDLVHGLFHLDGVAARAAGMIGRKFPYVVHIQGMPRRENLERLRVHKMLFGHSVKRAAAVIAVSRAAADALEVELGISAKPLLNGVFTESFSSVRFEDRASEPTILFPADPNDARKRLPLLAQAVSRLEDPWRSCRLAVAGTPAPDLMTSLHQTLGDRVVPLGVMDDQGMVDAYGRAWVTCLPAVREAFGLVVVESLAAGRPCVAVRDGGIPEILSADGRGAGWLAKPDDAETLAQALTVALDDSAAPEIVDECRRMAEPFDWSKRGKEFLRLYRDVAGT